MLNTSSQGKKKVFKDKPVEVEEKIKEKLIHINRVAKVVKGGRRFSFSALVVVGDHDGNVGLGFGKANEVAEAIRKAVQAGKKHMFKVKLDGHTIPYELTYELGAARVFMKPASAGTGIIAGGAVRAVLEAAGVRDILTKNLGTKNQINTAKAAIEALRSLKSKDEYALRRAIEPEEPKKRKDEDDDETTHEIKVAKSKNEPLVFVEETTAEAIPVVVDALAVAEAAKDEPAAE